MVDPKGALVAIGFLFKGNQICKYVEHNANENSTIMVDVD